MCSSTSRIADHSLSLTRALLMSLMFMGAMPAIVAAQAEFPALQGGQGFGPTDAELFAGSPNLPANLDFGRAIAADERTVLISLPGYLNGIGRVAVFSKNSAGNWERTGSIDPPRSVRDFGQGLQLNDDCAVVNANSGAYLYHRKHRVWVLIRHDPARLYCVHHRVIVADLNAVLVVQPDSQGRVDTLHPLQKLVSPVGNDEFAFSIAESQDTLVVGAPGDQDGRGAVYVFKLFEGRWVMRQKLIAIDGKPGDGFGSAVSIDDGMIAVGAPFEPSSEPPCSEIEGLGTGGVYVFTEHHTTWFQREKVATPACDIFFSGFGGNVAINSHILVATDFGTIAMTGPWAHAYYYHPLGGQFVPLGMIGSNEGILAVLAMSRSEVFVGFPLTRGVSIGGVLGYPFKHHHSGSDPD
jgi:hypothetical protein